MARLALAVIAVCVGMILTNNNFSVPYELQDKLWLVALLPGAFVLCIGLLRE